MYSTLKLCSSKASFKYMEGDMLQAAFPKTRLHLRGEDCKRSGNCPRAIWGHKVFYIIYRE